MSDHSDASNVHICSSRDFVERSGPPVAGDATSLTPQIISREPLAAIDDLLRDLEAAAASYRDRPLVWSDSATLSQVREYLSVAVKVVSSAEETAQLRKAARQVATEVRHFRTPESAYVDRR